MDTSSDKTHGERERVTCDDGGALFSFFYRSHFPCHAFHQTRTHSTIWKVTAGCHANGVLLCVCVHVLHGVLCVRAA